VIEYLQLLDLNYEQSSIAPERGRLIAQQILAVAKDMFVWIVGSRVTAQCELGLFQLRRLGMTVLTCLRTCDSFNICINHKLHIEITNERNSFVCLLATAINSVTSLMQYVSVKLPSN